MTQDHDLLAHHAYCIIGGVSARAGLISVLEKKHKIKTRGNPDLFDYSYATFTIDDARQIKSLAGTRPVTEAGDPGATASGRGKKIFILQMSGITVEAQNALLKLLEEPPEYAHFFLIIPSAHLLLPTVRSRISVIERDKREEKREMRIEQAAGISMRNNVLKSSVNASAFIKMPIPKRLEQVKALMDDISKEKRPKQDAIDFINAIQEAIYSRAHSIADPKGRLSKNAKALEAIETARTYMNDRAPSLKMLLEFVAMSV